MAHAPSPRAARPAPGPRGVGAVGRRGRWPQAGHEAGVGCAQCRRAQRLHYPYFSSARSDCDGRGRGRRESTTRIVTHMTT